MKAFIMSNSITERMESGKVGELLVQIRLLQFGVQAAPPVIDSGNDLIAVKKFVYKSIQVKSTSGDTFKKPKDDCLYHLLAVVLLKGNDCEYHLDSSP